MLFTPEYIELNRQMHTANPEFGNHGEQWADHIRKLVRIYGFTTVLDYGAGKRNLERALAPKISVTSYDPAIAEIAEHPTGKFDLVVCTDVLEHIEMACIDDVLADLASLTAHSSFLEIATFKAQKHLPDGTNTHLIVQKGPWWLERIAQHFVITNVRLVEDRVIVDAGRMKLEVEVAA